MILNHTSAAIDNWMGITIDLTNTASIRSRVGSAVMHNVLPIHSKMRGCILSDAGVVIKYLPTTNWAASDLDGSLGQVMVEIPAHYRIFTLNGNIWTCAISEVALSGYHLVPKSYIGAYEASINRTTGKLASVVNASTTYRGGNNTSAWDATYRSLLGRPVTNMSRTAFQTAARLVNADTKWNALVYNARKDMFWLYLIEYANTNCQLAYNAQLDASGYKQGGLGNGVTIWDGTWGTWNSYNPFVPCGYTNSLGNGSGEIAYNIKDTDGVTTIKTVYANRYRGVELPYGHIWEWMVGINLEILTDAGGGTSKVYVADNPANYSDSNYAGYTNRGLMARTSGYISKMIIGEFGEMIGSEASGGSTTGWCDYLYTDPVPYNGLRGVLASGASHHGSTCGFGLATTDYAPSNATAIIGSRLCYIP